VSEEEDGGKEDDTNRAGAWWADPKVCGTSSASPRVEHRSTFRARLVSRMTGYDRIIRAKN
jgi:hypothetical protein